MPDLGAAGQAHILVAVEVVGGDDDFLDAIGEQVRYHVGHRVRAGDCLPAGHRGMRVTQQLEGDVGVGRGGIADRQAARMGVGAVAHVLEDVVGVGERRHADPLRAFGAHVRAHHDVPPHPHRHRVATDACRDEAALDRLGRAVVRAARAIPGGADRGGQLAPGVDLVQTREPLLGRFDAGFARQAASQRAADHVGFELAVVRQQLALLLVELADDARRVGLAIQHALGEHLEERPLLLDDEDLFQALGEVAHRRRLHREQHAHLQDTDAVTGERRIVEAQLEEGLAQVVVGLARGDDAKPRVGVRKHDLVEIVLARVAFGDLEPSGVERLLHLQRLGPHVHAQVHVRRKGLAVEHQVGRDELEPLGRHLGGTGAVGDVGDDLQADPQPRQPRHQVAMQPEVENLLHVAGVQRGHADVEQHRLGLAAQRRGLAARIIADHRDDTAVLVDARIVGVLERIAAAVHARRLAVPHAGDAVELLVAHGVQHLRAPHRRGSQVFIDAVDELDVVFEQQLLLLDQRRVEHTHRRAAVARDEHAGLETAACVGAHLVECQAHQRVDAAEVDDAFFPGK